MSKINYSEDDLKVLTAMYKELGNKGLDAIAEKLGKSVPSVRSKLIKEGLYVVEEKKPQRKNGPTKKDLLSELQTLTGKYIDGLKGATKDAIKEVIDLVKEKQK